MVDYSRRFFLIQIIGGIVDFLLERIEEHYGMEKRRDRHEIVAEILNTALNGRIKTHIMYRAKLSFTQVNEYLPLLVEKGLLENTELPKWGSAQQCTKPPKRGLSS